MPTHACVEPEMVALIANVNTTAKPTAFSGTGIRFALNIPVVCATRARVFIQLMMNLTGASNVDNVPDAANVCGMTTNMSSRNAGNIVYILIVVPNVCNITPTYKRTRVCMCECHMQLHKLPGTNE